MAKRYGELVQDLWNGRSKSITPLKFRVSEYVCTYTGIIGTYIHVDDSKENSMAHVCSGQTTEISLYCLRESRLSFATLASFVGEI